MAVTLPRRRARDPEGRMPLREHLFELRSRLFKAAFGVAAGAVAGWFVYEPVLNALAEPVNDAGGTLNFSGIATAFDLKLKVSVFIGLLLSSPVWLYQLWAFITPGLTRRERRTAMAFVAVAVPLFSSGIAMAWYVLPGAVEFFLGFTPEEAANLLPANEYLTFVMRVLLAFGIAFLLPVVLVGLNLAGVVSGRAMGKQWRLAVFLCFLFAAVATPSSDATSMFALAGPMVAFYALAVGIALRVDRRRARRAPEWMQVADDEASPL